MREFAVGYFLEKETLDWFYDCYLPPGADKNDPKISPLRAKDLSGLPPAYVMLGGFDPLHDEGMQYADKLRAAGVQVTVADHTDMVHCFVYLQSFLPQAHEAVVLRRLLEGGRRRRLGAWQAERVGQRPMSLDVHVRNLLDQMAALKAPKLWEIGPQAARAAMKMSIFRGGDTPIGKVEDRKIPGPAGELALRVYTPVDAQDGSSPAWSSFTAAAS